MINFIFILLLLLIGCAAPERDGTSEPGVKSLNEVISNFERDAAEYGFDFRLQDYDFRFVDLIGNKIGYCSYSYINLDIDWWERAPDSRREALIYHELGHCILNQREHRTNSVMETYLIWDFYQRRAYYISELFNFGRD